MKPLDHPRSRPAWAVLSAAAALQMALHAAALTGYGIFRDELYYLSCASRPGAGYVDQPPFSILFLAVWSAVFGDSLASLRAPPLLLGAATVMLTGLLALRLGGSRAAQGLAALAAALAPISLGFTAYFSMNSFDLFFWALGSAPVWRSVLPSRRGGAGSGREARTSLRPSRGSFSFPTSSGRSRPAGRLWTSCAAPRPKNTPLSHFPVFSGMSS